MNSSSFQRWVKRILETETEEISCSVCFDLVSDYVDAELSGDLPAGKWDKLRHHLHQCKACMDDYLVLRDLASLERETEDPG